MARCKLYVQPVLKIPSKEQNFIFQPDIKLITLIKRKKIEKVKIISEATINLEKEKIAEKQLQALTKNLKNTKKLQKKI
ncbi:hypothetical protein HRbin34_00569 [bacterium HR34]|nr:hypothetical protein HRbin34_00569 [bacterium HR34]